MALNEKRVPPPAESVGRRYQMDAPAWPTVDDDMSERILLVDDDDLLRRSLAFSLENSGYEVVAAATAEDALARVKLAPPDLILLDVGLPGMDGLQALRRLQELGSFPVIFLTARRRELDEVLGLELGADDYVTKPYDLDVLLARIRAVLRRSHRPVVNPPAEQVVTVGDLTIDPAAHSVTVAGEPVHLAAREFDLLRALAVEAGRVVSVDDLLRRVWGPDFRGEPQVVYVHIRWLREKLERDPQNPRRIITVRGVGYKLVAPREA